MHNTSMPNWNTLLPTATACPYAPCRSCVPLLPLQVCYLEIYNELLYDLLELTTQPQDVTIHEDGRGRVRLQGLRCCEVTSEAQALQLLFEVGSSIRAQDAAAAAVFQLSDMAPSLAPQHVPCC